MAAGEEDKEKKKKVERRFSYGCEHVQTHHEMQVISGEQALHMARLLKSNSAKWTSNLRVSSELSRLE